MRRHHQRREFFVVNGYGIGLFDFHLHRRALACRDHLGRDFDALVNVVAHRFVQRANGADHFHFFRNNIEAITAMDAADGHDRRLRW